MEKNVAEILSKNMRFLRMISGLTQKQLGEYLGLSKEQISYIENRKRSIDIIKLTKIANLFGVSLDVFLNYEISESDINIFSFRCDDIDVNMLNAIAFLNEFANNLIKLKSLK